jgi:FHA domain
MRERCARAVQRTRPARGCRGAAELVEDLRGGRWDREQGRVDIFAQARRALSSLVFVEERPVAGRVLPAEPETTVGREGDVMLADPEASRLHAVIRTRAAIATIEDLGSTNGTFVNGEPISGPTPLRPGDEIRFGSTVWRVEARGARTRVTARSRQPSSRD